MTSSCGNDWPVSRKSKGNAYVTSRSCVRSSKMGRICSFFSAAWFISLFFRIHMCFRQCFLCLTSYLPINHIPSGVWGAGGRAAPYACSSVPVSLLPEEQTTSLEVRKRMAHASCTNTHNVPHELIIVFPAPVSWTRHDDKFTILPNNKSTIPTNQTLTEQTDIVLWSIPFIKNTECHSTVTLKLKWLIFWMLKLFPVTVWHAVTQNIGVSLTKQPMAWVWGRDNLTSSVQGTCLKIVFFFFF